MKSARQDVEGTALLAFYPAFSLFVGMDDFTFLMVLTLFYGNIQDNYRRHWRLVHQRIILVTVGCSDLLNLAKH